jgi:hypothetical protein
MAGYSGTPLVQKLGIKPRHRVALVQSPIGFDRALAPLPDGVEIANEVRGRKPFDVILYFTTARAELQKRFDTLALRLTPAGGLWIAWPKKASRVPTDLTENVIRAAGLETGLVDNKVCAVDDTWSGLRFVVRLVDRPKPSARNTS